MRRTTERLTSTVLGFIKEWSEKSRCSLEKYKKTQRAHQKASATLAKKKVLWYCDAEIFWTSIKTACLMQTQRLYSPQEHRPHSEAE